MNKKTIPLELVKSIEKIAQANLDIIRLEKDDNCFYSFVEKGKDPLFHFKIFIFPNKHINNFKSSYGCTFKPINEKKTSRDILQGNIEEISAQFEKWIELVREIHETPSIYDDNFSKSYSDYFYSEFNIVDDDKNTAPFNPKQQERIEAYLKSLTKMISTSEELQDNELKEQLLVDINSIENSLTVSTKDQVMKRITSILGKLYKICKPLGKEAAKEFGKQALKKIIEFGLENIPKLLN